MSRASYVCLSSAESNEDRDVLVAQRFNEIVTKFQSRPQGLQTEHSLPRDKLQQLPYGCG